MKTLILGLAFGAVVLRMLTRTEPKAKPKAKPVPKWAVPEWEPNRADANDGLAKMFHLSREREQPAYPYGMEFPKDDAFEDQEPDEVMEFGAELNHMPKPNPPQWSDEVYVIGDVSKVELPMRGNLTVVPVLDSKQKQVGEARVERNGRATLHVKDAETAQAIHGARSQGYSYGAKCAR